MMLAYHIHGDGLVAKLCPSLVAPWTVDHQTPLAKGFPKQECSSGLPFPSPRDLSNPGIEPQSPALQADSLMTELPGKFTYHIHLKAKNTSKFLFIYLYRYMIEYITMIA